MPPPILRVLQNTFLHLAVPDSVSKLLQDLHSLSTSIIPYTIIGEATSPLLLQPFSSFWK